MKLKDLRITEQLAYQLLQFLGRYRADVSHLLSLQPNSEAIRQYLEAMADGECRDAERLKRALEEALEARERSVGDGKQARDRGADQPQGREDDAAH